MKVFGVARTDKGVVLVAPSGAEYLFPVRADADARAVGVRVLQVLADPREAMASTERTKAPRKATPKKRPRRSKGGEIPKVLRRVANVVRGSASFEEAVDRLGAEAVDRILGRTRS